MKLKVQFSSNPLFLDFLFEVDGMHIVEAFE